MYNLKLFINVTFKVVLIFAFILNCKTSLPYFKDRGNDVLDIFDLRVVGALGVEVKSGPISVGLHGGARGFGLKGGEVEFQEDMSLTIGLGFGSGLCCFHAEYYGSQKPNYRNKYFTGGRIQRNEGEFKVQMDDISPLPLYQYTRLALRTGFIYGVEIAFNPGELLDFALGLFGIDLFDDDYHSKQSSTR